MVFLFFSGHLFKETRKKYISHIVDMRSMKFTIACVVWVFMSDARARERVCFLFLSNYRRYARLWSCATTNRLIETIEIQRQIPSTTASHFDWSICFTYFSISFFLLPGVACLFFTNRSSVSPHSLTHIFFSLFFIRETIAYTREITLIINTTSNNNHSFNKWLLSCLDGF